MQIILLDFWGELRIFLIFSTYISSYPEVAVVGLFPYLILAWGVLEWGFPWEFLLLLSTCTIPRHNPEMKSFSSLTDLTDLFRHILRILSRILRLRKY